MHVEVPCTGTWYEMHTLRFVAAAETRVELPVVPGTGTTVLLQVNLLALIPRSKKDFVGELGCRGQRWQKPDFVRRGLEGFWFNNGAQFALLPVLQVLSMPTTYYAN